MKARTFFVGACLAAAVWPGLAALIAPGAGAKDAAASAAGARSAIEWPARFRGRPLTQLAASPVQARFAARFPGAVARFAVDGTDEVLIARRVARATRMLHPAADCFRAAGYAVETARAAVDADGVRWSCFVAARGALSARPGDWTVALHFTRRHAVELNVAGLVRLATTPLALRALDGFEKTTSFGHLRFVRAAHTFVVRCEPCGIEHPRLAGRAIVLPSAELRLARRRDAESNRLDGELSAGGVRIEFVATLRSRGIDLDWSLAPTDIAALVRLFGDAIPEQRHARIAGTLAAHGTLALPALRGQASVQLAGFAVDALNTAQYAWGEFRHACRGADGALRWVATGDGERGWVALDALGAWLPAAVLAAEDQRFHAHAGIDLDELGAALAAFDPGGAGLRGASTITQQLARTLVTGGERTLARKIRETLYAVEMERTLGKPRIVELYLNTVDWGPGICGAPAAARTYFRKRPAQLSPLEAAWLAGMLRNPHDAHAHEFRRGAPQLERAIWVLSQMRALPKHQRQRWARAPLAFAAERDAAPASRCRTRHRACGPGSRLGRSTHGDAARRARRSSRGSVRKRRARCRPRCRARRPPSPTRCRSPGLAAK